MSAESSRAEWAWIERAVEGDVEAFEHLAEVHRPEALRLALALLGDAEAAEDIAQELLIRLSVALPGFRGDSELKTWVYRVTLNLCRDHMRRARRRPQGVPLEESGAQAALTTHPSHERSLDAQRAISAVREAIDRLPTEQREVVSMRYITDLPYKEIARITGTPIGTVASRVFRALQQLGRDLEPRHLEILK